ncbi:MAG TPA: outer membrane beta-barrel protein, partial [Candidatus Dormibacteraeota bacterium]|nr:outer membrane beta-barrel protein [Candidatus Dormibacteraeota bacterium]
MNKIVASVGLAALGASGLQAASVPGITEDSPNKPWTVSVALRGFYDDNIDTAPNSQARDSFGFEVSPSAALAMTWPQTKLSAGYTYSFKYYDRKPIGNTENYDQTHNLNLALDHNFSERFKGGVSDSFVIGQEPDVLRSGNIFETFQRISGNNIRNYGSIYFQAQITPLFGVKVSYGNAYFDYSSDQGSLGNPSLSGLLDRIEHTPSLDTLWTITPETVGVFGYQYRETDYTANEELTIVEHNGEFSTVRSQDRNFREHYLYVGLDHSFAPNLTGSVRVGGRYVEYYNDPTGSGDGWGPYAMANLRWTYMPKSYVELGVSHDISATDVARGGVGSFTTSTESTVVYGSVNHQFTPKLHGSLLGEFQDSVFQGGDIDSSAEYYYLLGLNFTYQFTPN